MKILITGVTGFVGSALARTLVGEGKYIVGGVVRTTSDHNHMDTIRDIADKISIHYANLADHHAIRSAIKSFAPNIIVHVGAKTAVRESFEAPQDFNETNFIGTINLVHAALEVPNFKKFIFASTMETYGWQKQRKPFAEDIILHPGSPYSVSKAACEYYLEMASKAYGLPYCISRACNTYGRTHNSRFVVEYLVTSMLKGNDIYIGTPKAVRDLMYIDDHVDAYMKMIKSSIVNQTFNFGTGNQMTMENLVEILKKKLNYKGKIFHCFPPNYPFRPVAEEYLSLNANKAKKILKWQPKYSLEKGLDKTIAYWRSRV